MASFKDSEAGLAILEEMFRVAPRLTESDGGYPLELFPSKEVPYIQRFFRRLIENPGMLKLPARSGANAAEL